MKNYTRFINVKSVDKDFISLKFLILIIYRFIANDVPMNHGLKNAKIIKSKLKMVIGGLINKVL